MLTRYGSLAVFLLLVVGATMIAGQFEAGEWYHLTMQQPSLTPPDWLYILTWPLVYILMALAAWRIWLTGHESRLGALAWWTLLLVLTIAWSVLFFGLHRPGWAMPLLALSAGVVLFCLRAFNRLSQEAALMLLPALLWIAYLLVFDLAVWSSNGGFLSHLFS